MAYLLVAWVLEHNSASNGLGFPFDRPHLEFYLRMESSVSGIETTKRKRRFGITHSQAKQHHHGFLPEKTGVAAMQEKITVFDELRTAMRIASPDGHSGLNDEGDDGIKTIEARVKQFRHSVKVEKLAGSDISYQKMVKQIDKYWDKLFADPIQVNTPNGKITLATAKDQ